jgi:cation diffusion facilitator CzcD-associated flavoprotein CzcO
VPAPRIAIIGAGPGGIAMAITLREAGFDDFVLFEKAPGVGGTWWHNTYPGAACDVPSALYSFSFAIKRDWSRPYATQPEIRAYFEELVEKYELADRIRLSTAVESARWNDDTSEWHLLTEHGDEYVADVVVSAIGMFNEPHTPAIDGLHDFAGTMFHSGRWDHAHDLAGERVGVIGSAASAVQFVPEIAPRVEQLHVFQRTPNWVLPKQDTPYTAEQLERFRSDPQAMTDARREVWERLEPFITFSVPAVVRAAEDIGRQTIAVVNDPVTRAALTPDFPHGCKRPLVSNDWYPTFNRHNVELVTERIDHITRDAIVTADGRSRPVDTIVLATGFETTKYLAALDVVGRDGRHLRDAWRDGAQAYLGVTTAGFPNLFMLYGPNTNNGSILFMIECQVAYALRHLERMRDEHLAWMDVRPEVMEAYNVALQADMDAVDVWNAACNGYYRGPNGRIVTQWPHNMAEYARRTQQPDVDAFVAGTREVPANG